MDHHYTATDGKGQQIVLLLQRITYVTPVAPQQAGYSFEVQYQSNQLSIRVGYFLNEEDAAQEYHSLKNACLNYEELHSK